MEYLAAVYRALIEPVVRLAESFARHVVLVVAWTTENPLLALTVPAVMGAALGALTHLENRRRRP